LLFVRGAGQQDPAEVRTRRANNNPPLALLRNWCIFNEIEVENADIKAERLVVIAHYD